MLGGRKNKMNVIIHIDEWSGWQHPAAGMTLANRLISAVANSESVRRIVLVVNTRWATGISGKNPIFLVPSSVDGIAPATTLIWEQPPVVTQLKRVYRVCDLNSALVLGRANLYIWPFMIDEVFLGKPNKEYGLQETTWRNIIEGTATDQHTKECKYRHDVDTLQYIYSEMASGAAWEELLVELEDGKQEPIPSKYERSPGADAT
jgi:hypothetical protein